MVTRVNGGPLQAVWVEREVLFLQVTSDNSDWIEQAGVNGGTEQVLEKVAQYATILGVTFGSADDLWVMVGYAGGFTAGLTEGTSGSVEETLGADIDAITTPINFANTTVDTFAGFSGITPDTTP